MTTDEDSADFDRLPGLFRAWDLPFVLQGNADYRIDACAPTSDGTPLFQVFARSAAKTEAWHP
jgi:hypothetical protein